MPVSPDIRIQVVRHFLALDQLTKRWPPGRIAREVGFSETTIKRDKRVIETSPNPVLRARPHIPALALILAAAAVFLVAAAAVTALLIRSLHAPAPAQSPQVTVCVRYGTGGVTGVAGGRCPPGWQTVTLTPGGTP